MPVGAFCCCLLIIVFTIISAQAEYAFTNPDPYEGSGVQAFYIGEPMEISWRVLTNISQQSRYSVSGNIVDPSGFASLWIRPYDYLTNIHLIAYNLNINTTKQSELRTTWICNLTDAEVLAYTLWFFEMKPNIASWLTPYSGTRDEWPSGPFKVLAAVSSAASTTIAKSTSSSISVLPTPTTSSTASPVTGSLSTGAKAGIGTGAAVAVIIITILGVLLFQQRPSRQQVSGDENQSLSRRNHAIPNLLFPYRPHEFPPEGGQFNVPQELHAHMQRAELVAHYGSELPPTELGN